MSSTSTTASGALPTGERRRLGRIYLLEAKSELLKTLRLPAFVLPTLLFPLVFYLFFGVMFGAKSAGAVSVSAYMLATYGAFGVIGAALFNFGVNVAIERGQGWMEVKRATPMPPGAYFFGKIATSSIFAAIISLLFFALAATAGGVRLVPATWALLFVVLVAGSLPFCALGLAAGYFAGPNSAPAVLNLIYLPMAFLSGLWIPVAMLPKTIQAIAPWLPPYHLAEIALGIIGAGDTGALGAHVLALLGFTALFLVLARIGYLRDEGKTYG